MRGEIWEPPFAASDFCLNVHFLKFLLQLRFTLPTDWNQRQIFYIEQLSYHYSRLNDYTDAMVLVWLHQRVDCPEFGSCN